MLRPACSALHEKLGNVHDLTSFSASGGKFELIGNSSKRPVIAEQYYICQVNLVNLFSLYEAIEVRMMGRKA